MCSSHRTEGGLVPKSMENMEHFLLLMTAPFLLLIIYKALSRSKKINKPPPSPPSLPLLGHFHLINTSALHQTLSSLSSKYGPVFSFRLGRKSFVVVSSPSAVEECFTQKNDVVLANRPRSVAGDILSYGYKSYAWSPYGQFWRVMRRLSVVEMFSSHSLSRSAETREEELRAILRATRGQCVNNKGKVVNLGHLISCFSFNHMTMILAGRRYIEEDEIWRELGKESLRWIRETFAASSAQGVCDFFPVLRWIGYKGVEKNLRLMHKKRDDFFQKMVDEARCKNEDEAFKDDDNKNSCVVKTLLSLQAEEPQFYTEEIIKSFLQVMYIAGTETSSLTAEWAMSFLLSHPDSLRKLRQEIDEKVGNDHLASDSDLPNLPYLSYIVKETLRLYPPVPLLLPRYSSEACTILGYTVPKDTIVLVNAWSMHRDPKVWNEPEKFSPDRFEFEREGYKFVPFGMGRRACPASSMGLRTISLVLAGLVQCFEWEKSPDYADTEVNNQSRVTLKKAKPLEAFCVPRDQATNLLSQL